MSHRRLNKTRKCFKEKVTFLVFESEGGLDRGCRFDSGVLFFHKEEVVSSSSTARLGNRRCWMTMCLSCFVFFVSQRGFVPLCAPYTVHFI